MEALLWYFGKLILCSAVMFGYYLLILKDKTFHHYNRFYLLSTVVISVFLPFLKTDYFTIEINPKLFQILQNLKPNSVETIAPENHLIFNVLLSVLGIVTLFILGKLVVGILKINVLKKQYPKTELGGIHFYETDLNDAPFSFFRNLFWKKSILIDSDLGKQILKHEMVHIEQKHSWDKLFMELMISLFWFNPIFWFIKKELNLIHEYLADKKAVKNMDTKAFAQMLLASHFSGTVLPATSPFLSSNLKKRLTMLKQSKTKFGYARKVLALPMLFILAFAYLVNAKNKEIKQTNNEIDLAVQSLKKDTVVPSTKKLNKDAKIKAKETRRIERKAKRIDRKAEKLALKAQELENSPEIKKQIADAKEQAAKAREYVNSPEFKKQIADAKKAVDYNSKSNIVVIDNNKNKPKVFLDGKEIPEEEMNRINPNTIESVNVIKKDKTSQGEIYIITKQNALKIPNK